VQINTAPAFILNVENKFFGNILLEKVRVFVFNHEKIYVLVP